MTEPRAPDAAALRADLRRFARAESPPWLHGEVARRMAARLPAIRLQPRRVAEWWAHAGASDALLGAAYPRARRVLVEPTAALLERSAGGRRRRWWAPGPARAADARLERDVVPESCDLLWGNMVLHLAADPPALFAQWQGALAPDGFLMCSGFGPDTLRELRALYQRLGWGPPAQDFVDMHDVGDMLVHAGFADPVMDQERIRLTFPDAKALLVELRGLGGNAAPARFAALRTPRWRSHLARELETLAGNDGRIAMSFEIVYGHAFKAAPRGETTLSLEAMRSLLPSRRGGGDALR